MRKCLLLNSAAVKKNPKTQTHHNPHLQPVG